MNWKRSVALGRSGNCFSTNLSCTALRRPATASTLRRRSEVLEFLLPVGDLEIRGAARAVNEICDVSGYRNNPQAFSHLLQILDTELRLITPHEPGLATSQGRTASYQLTHDYLVPSLREWLDRQRSDTARGRAGLRLERLATAYSIDRDTRHIPKALDYCRIAALTERSRWSKEQGELMRRAGKRMLAVSLLLALALGTLVIFVMQQRGRRSEPGMAGQSAQRPNGRHCPSADQGIPWRTTRSRGYPRLFRGIRTWLPATIQPRAGLDPTKLL